MSLMLKVGDFGFAKHLSHTSLAETLCGSPLYMAPEILFHQNYDSKGKLLFYPINFLNPHQKNRERISLSHKPFLTHSYVSYHQLS